jgi:hypothetical protein
MIIRLLVEATTLGVGSGGKLRPGNGDAKACFGLPKEPSIPEGSIDFGGCRTL